jgi:ribosomal-protein-alanine N-acetyltransferase
MNFNIETERLILRNFQLDDAQDLFEMDNDPEVHRFLGNKPIQSIEKCEEVIKGVMNQYEEFGAGRLPIVLKETGEMVGWAGLKYETSLEQFGEYYDMGYRLKRKHWGKGIATEAAIASINYGFDHMGLEIINAGAHVDHVVSNHIIHQKLGFKHLLEFEWDNDPCNWYELKKADWLKG